MIRVKDKGDLYVHQDANWNIVALTDLGGHVVERYVYSPYGQVTVYQETSFGDYDGDGDVDQDDKGAMVNNPPLVGYCYGTTGGACRVLDLDFDGDQDSADETLFDALPQGLARHPSLTATGVHQPFAHQGLLFEPEIGSYQNRKRQYAPSARRFLQRDPLGKRDGLNAYAYVRGNPLGALDPQGTSSHVHIQELGDRIEVTVGIAFWGSRWLPNGSPSVDVGQHELETTWNVPAHSGQGVFSRSGCSAGEPCGSSCKRVVFKFPSVFVNSSVYSGFPTYCNGSSRSDGVFWDYECYDLATQVTGKDVSAFIRPDPNFTCDPGETCQYPQGGGVSNEVGGTKIQVDVNLLGLSPTHILSHEIGHVLGLVPGTGHDFGSEHAGHMMRGGDPFEISRTVAHHEVVDVLRENGFPNAGECGFMTFSGSRALPTRRVR